MTPRLSWSSRCRPTRSPTSSRRSWPRIRTRSSRMSRASSRASSRSSSSPAPTSRATSALTRWPGASAGERSRRAPTCSSDARGSSPRTRRRRPSRSHVLEDLALDLGATPVQMTADEHDRGVALVSHVPQLVASLLAARLRPASDAADRPRRPGTARHDPHRRQQSRALGADPRRERRTGRRGAERLPRRPRPRDLRARGAAGIRSSAHDRRDPRRRQCRASRASPASTVRIVGSPRSSSRSTTAPASSLACSPRSARRASTWKTCASSTRPVRRSDSPRSLVMPGGRGRPRRGARGARVGSRGRRAMTAGRRRDRRARRQRQVERQQGGRAPARLRIPRHGRGVPRADLVRARARSRPDGCRRGARAAARLLVPDRSSTAAG